MSRKNEKKDDEGIGGKVLTGLAVGVVAAAAGAAIGYFGRQLFSAWQEEQEKEQNTCAKKIADEEKEFTLSKNDDIDRRHVKKLDSSGTSGNVNVPPVTVKQPSVSLHDHLMNYYRDYVNIPASILADAQKVVEEVKSNVSGCLRDGKQLGLPNLKIGDLVLFGSTAEGLKVVHPDVFDVMVPVRLQSECVVKPSDLGAESHKGSFRIDVQSGCDTLCDHSNRLISTNLASSLLQPIRQACDKCRYNTEVHLSGSSIMVSVSSHGQQSSVINFVPVVIVDNKLFVPQLMNRSSHLSEASDAEDEATVQWNVLYARQEQWSIDRFDSGIVGHRIAIKILKAIRLNHSEQFGNFSSYHIKNLLFHVLEDLPENSDWHETAVGERLIDLLVRLTQVLNEHNLPHYFEQSVNLLEAVPKEECTILARFIEKKLGHNDIASLLERTF